MNDPLMTRIHQLAEAIFPDVLEDRRWLHKNAELSFNEVKTGGYIAEKLQKMNIQVRTGIASTGVIGILTGKTSNGPVVGLRADMDALPVEEATNLPFSSQNPGVMHACGHDAHTASLLGTARILSELKDQWEGTALLIFQPGEEKFPGGASILLKEGALNQPKPDLIIGQHVLPEMETGHVGFRSGKYMASGDEIHITVRGKGGHGALPHNLNDTVLAASHIIVSLQQIVSRIVPATIPTVLSFGFIEGKGATNIIPEKVTLAGTLRTMNEEWRKTLKEKIKEIANSTATGYGCSCEIDIKDGYPMVDNNEFVTYRAKELAEQYLGKSNIESMDIRMTAEDFGYYSQDFPCTFYRFGVKQIETTTGDLHTPSFNLNENSLKSAPGLMAWIATGFLSPEVLQTEIQSKSKQT